MLMSLFYRPQLALGLFCISSQFASFHSGKSSPHHPESYHWLAVGIFLLILWASGALLIDVHPLWESCSVVQAVKSDCPVSYCLWATAVGIYDIPARKRVLCNCKKYLGFCAEFGWFVVLQVHFLVILRSCQYSRNVEFSTVSFCAMRHGSTKS